MTIEIRIKDGDTWRGPNEDEFNGRGLDYRVALLAKKETVVRLQTDDQEIIISTGMWVDYYKQAGKVSISLVELSELLTVHPTIASALKTLGGEILKQETLF
jgi:hypothetical protein